MLRPWFLTMAHRSLVIICCLPTYGGRVRRSPRASAVTLMNTTPAERGFGQPIGIGVAPCLEGGGQLVTGTRSSPGPGSGTGASVVSRSREAGSTAVKAAIRCLWKGPAGCAADPFLRVPNPDVSVRLPITESIKEAPESRNAVGCRVWTAAQSQLQDSPPGREGT